MKVLQIIRTEPDDTVQNLSGLVSMKDDTPAVLLYQGEVDWPKLVDDIFAHDKIICWW
jgi:hypothetical protein